MGFATLLVHTDVDDEPAHRVALATKLADKIASKLIGFSAAMVPPPIGTETGAILEVLNAETDDLKKRLSAKEAWFRKVAGNEQHRLSWRFSMDYPNDALAREARCADLLIVGRGADNWKSAYSTLDLGEIALKAGRPVLTVPNGISILNAKHVVIGWKDTREARRAVQDALPFLHEATKVSVVEICSSDAQERCREQIDDVVVYLGRHRIGAKSKIITRGKASDAAELIKFAQDEGSDLLVTGAYGHSRLGEWMFGGVTRELLASSPICCLLSH